MGGTRTLTVTFARYYRKPDEGAQFRSTSNVCVRSEEAAHHKKFRQEYHVRAKLHKALIMNYLFYNQLVEEQKQCFSEREEPGIVR